jgi:hypothetical protein
MICSSIDHCHHQDPGTQKIQTEISVSKKWIHSFLNDWLDLVLWHFMILWRLLTVFSVLRFYDNFWFLWQVGGLVHFLPYSTEFHWFLHNFSFCDRTSVVFSWTIKLLCNCVKKNFWLQFSIWFIITQFLSIIKHDCLQLILTLPETGATGTKKSCNAVNISRNPLQTDNTIFSYFCKEKIISMESIVNSFSSIYKPKNNKKSKKNISHRTLLCIFVCSVHIVRFIFKIHLTQFENITFSNFYDIYIYSVTWCITL